MLNSSAVLDGGRHCLMRLYVMRFSGDSMTLKSTCPCCQSVQSWVLGDGRLKCRDCSMRYSWRSVWDGVRLPEQTKHELLEAFVQGVTAYRQRFDEGACIDTRE